jgi:APA family basic amino acid/polyamine antiporter
MNLPALFILLLISLVLMRGTKESAVVNNIIVAVKLAIVLIFIAIGWNYINPANHAVMVPANTGDFGDFGWSGVLSGAGIVFFAFIGFDAVSTAAQEAKNPQKGMPIGILVSLAVCTILYIVFAYVLTGVANYKDFGKGGAGHEASVAYAITTYMKGYAWLSTAITIAILAGFSSVILVLLMGQSRVFFSMANDGLLPKVFSDLHPKYRTTYKSNWILFVFVGAFAAFVPGSVAGDLTSFGTLFAFVLVSAGIWILRVKSPNMERPFKTPLVPLVPILGAIICLAMIFALDAQTLKVAFAWMALGLVVYFAYSRKKSKLNNED